MVVAVRDCRRRSSDFFEIQLDYFCRTWVWRIRWSPNQIKQWCRVGAGINVSCHSVFQFSRTEFDWCVCDELFPPITGKQCVVDGGILCLLVSSIKRPFRSLLWGPFSWMHCREGITQGRWEFLNDSGKRDYNSKMALWREALWVHATCAGNSTSPVDMRIPPIRWLINASRANESTTSTPDWNNCKA